MDGEIRFHLDECVPTAVAAGLRRRGIDVTTTPELGLRQAEDLSQLDVARKAGRVLVTQGRIIKGLVLIHGVLTEKDMEGILEFL